MTKENLTLVPSSGNIFADMGFNVQIIIKDKPNQVINLQC
jgi:hypothetical protein